MIRCKIARRFPAGPDSPAFDIDLEFEAAEGVTVLYGPSGSGKTLTLDSIAGFAVLDSGRIMLDDRIVFDAESGIDVPARLRACGYVFQNQALFPHMTLRENLAFAAHALPRLERHKRIATQLERFKLTELARRYPHELSGGQKQRASIARALLVEPQVVLLDEPTRGLDAALRSDFYRLVADIRSSLHIPILLVTHDPEECFVLASYVLVYEAGLIIHRGTPAELLRNPGTVAAANVLGNFNIYEAEVLSLDPSRQSSRLKLLDAEISGPHLRGCFRGDQVTLCARPEELKLSRCAGENRIRRDLRRSADRSQMVRADFGDGLIVDVPRETWNALESGPHDAGWWIEIPAASLRQINRVASGTRK